MEVSWRKIKEVRMDAKEKLIKALEQANAPTEMIKKAQVGHYGDFTSPIAMPITQLVIDATANRLMDIAKRAKDGEFDG